MKKMMNFGAIAGLILIFLSAGYYDTQLLAGKAADFSTFVPAIVGIVLLVLWLNGKAVRRYIRGVARRLPKVIAEERRLRAMAK